MAPSSPSPRSGGMTPTVLVIEDEPDVLALVSYGLRQAGLDVEEAADGETGLQRASETPVDLVVLDLMLPGIDGLEILRLLKRQPRHRELPVIILTARTEEVDRIVGLELGADDYLTKPFSPRELVLRAKAVLRRSWHDGSGPDASRMERIEINDLVIDPPAHRATVGASTIQLTATEFRLLLALAQNPGRVQSRQDLLAAAWGYEHTCYQRTVDTHIRRLRAKLGRVGQLLETVRGVGYRFRCEPP